MGGARYRLYSLLRDAAGRGDVEGPCGVTLREALEEIASRYRGLGEALRAIEWSVYGLLGDGSRVDLEDSVPCGVEVHVIPPPSGGSSGRLIRAVILGDDEPLSIEDAIEEASRAAGDVGAVAVFVGRVKGYNLGSVVDKLYYEAAPGVAEKVIESILREEAERHDLRAAIVFHYTGTRLPGEVTFAVLVSGRSRKNVFPALEVIVERVKREAPIWKTEYRADGSKAYILGDRIVRLEGVPGAGDS